MSEMNSQSPPKGNYKVPAGEEKLYHVKIEVEQYDSRTGKKISFPREQKFGIKAFNMALRDLKNQGYTVEILHDPTKNN